MNNLDKKAIEEWNEELRKSEMTDEDHALENTREQLRIAHIKGRAKEVMAIINESATERQIKIFFTFVHTNNYRETARILGIDKKRVQVVVNRVREIVNERLGSPHFSYI